MSNRVFDLKGNPRDDLLRLLFQENGFVVDLKGWIPHGFTRGSSELHPRKEGSDDFKTFLRKVLKDPIPLGQWPSILGSNIEY